MEIYIETLIHTFFSAMECESIYRKRNNIYNTYIQERITIQHTRENTQPHTQRHTSVSTRTQMRSLLHSKVFIENERRK